MSGSANILAFIDLLFNLLLGITVMMIIAFVMMNPVTTPTIEQRISLMVELEWDPESDSDIDIWMRGPDQSWVGFNNKDGTYMTLERDDRGKASDQVVINGMSTELKQNYEVIRLSQLPIGEYVVNVHNFKATGNAESVKVKISKMDPFEISYSGSVSVSPKQEVTLISFTVANDGNITDLRTDIQIPHVSLFPKITVPSYLPEGVNP